MWFKCCRMQEKHVLEMQCKHQRNILELQEKLKLNLQQVYKCHCIHDHYRCRYIQCLCTLEVFFNAACYINLHVLLLFLCLLALC